MKSAFKHLVHHGYSRVRKTVRKADSGLMRLMRMEKVPFYPFSDDTGIEDIRRKTLDYVARSRVSVRDKFRGYRHSASTTEPILYATIAALLLKKLYSADEGTAPELEYLRNFQSDDGLFRDPAIDCEIAETEDSWGWRHLTLHALMTLALYGEPACKELEYLKRFKDKDSFRRYLESRDWGPRTAWTSNELQNVGVMLQYARDHQSVPFASDLLEMLFETIEEKQDCETGLYGHRFGTREELSLGVQAGYHFWLLYFYDNRPVPRTERVIDSILRTQNIMGGYGVMWNSSACEDIDSIDPLVRFSAQTTYRSDDIQDSLARGLPAVLMNLNSDGGWVFKRHEALTVVHSQMFSDHNESNMLYTWFRTLGLAYCLTGMRNAPRNLHWEWVFGRAPGHQFL